MERLSDYDYPLPETAIAQEPLPDRSASRLLWLNLGSGEIRHRKFREVPEILREGDLLVVNDTRVTALRLFGQKETGAAVEALLLDESEPSIFEALMKPGKRLPAGTRVSFGQLQATVEEDLPHARKRLRFQPREDLYDRLREIGRVPLPPYIRKELEDGERYQTVYGRQGGSAAAPTAGLHFTPEILNKLAQTGVELVRVTLDVGVDTFRPVAIEDPTDHPMHGERCTVPPETVEAVARAKGRVVAVGTTAVRTLESMAEGPRKLRAGSMTTKLFIRPGYRFQIVDGMFTNFHMPRTTMLFMLAALGGRENVLDAYTVALREGYRFLSFGDSMLLL